MPHHALVTQSEGGVTQRWCESAKWISRPVLAADWPGMTPYTAKPPHTAMMWRSPISLLGFESLTNHLAQQNEHIIHLFSSFLLCSALTTSKTYATCAAPFAYCGFAGAVHAREDFKSHTKWRCSRSVGSHQREVSQTSRNDQDIDHGADLG